jgi:hypothetical protein
MSDVRDFFCIDLLAAAGLRPAGSEFRDEPLTPTHHTRASDNLYYLAAGGWRLAAGGWRLAAGGWRALVESAVN